MAWIILKDGVTATEDDIRSFCDGNVSRHKIPKHIKFTDEYPLPPVVKSRSINCGSMRRRHCKIREENNDKKIVVANRGEIAARIIRTCKKLDIETVAVYSEADQKAPFVSMADESYLLGPSRVQESYLNAEKIISLAEKAGADAIHPGYGFLSENSQFANKCQGAGLVFIGPSSRVMEQMGNKIAARKAMKNAGVPIVPGTDEAVANVEEAKEIAESIGYPIMLKAASGGGGIGMQVSNRMKSWKKHSTAMRGGHRLFR